MGRNALIRYVGGSKKNNHTKEVVKMMLVTEEMTRLMVTELTEVSVIE